VRIATFASDLALFEVMMDMIPNTKETERGSVRAQGTRGGPRNTNRE